MSTPIGGTGGVTPLQPTAQQPAVQQQQTENQTVVPQQQAPAKTGQTINNINNFNSQPVSTDLQQLQQWLVGLKNPGVATAQPPPLQQAQANSRKKESVVQQQQTQTKPEQETEARTHFQGRTGFNTSATITAPGTEQALTETLKPPELDSTQKKRLQVGIRKLAEKAGIGEANFARLVHAKATGNDAFYNYQLGKLNIPPTSAKGKLLETGLDKLFAAIKASDEAIADQTSKLIAVDDVGRLAKAVGIAPTLAVDLGALTHNEQDRFLELAKATGVPREKAIKLLEGFKKLGEQFDMDAAELDEILGNASTAVNTALDKAMNQAADKLGLTPETFNKLANAVLTKNTSKFIQTGQQAGFTQNKIKSLLPQLSSEISTIQAKPAFTGEKILRYTQDIQVQQQIEKAGKGFGLSSEQTLQLTAALVDGGLSGFVDQAKEFGLKNNAQNLLNKLEAIEKQYGKGILSLATNNVDSVVAQRKAMKELGMQSKPIEWATIRRSPLTPRSKKIRGPFGKLGPFGSLGPVFGGICICRGKTNIASKFEQSVQNVLNQNELRYVMLTDKAKALDKQIGQIKKFIFHHKVRGKLNRLTKERNEVAAQLKSLEESGIKPGPEQIQRIRKSQQLTNLREQLKEMEAISKKSRLHEFKLYGKIKDLKSQIRNLEQSLQIPQAQKMKSIFSR